MTVDRFVEDRRARWARLGNLIPGGERRVERLAPDDVLELGRLYRSASSDLAVARRDFALDAATERLNDLVAAGHALVYSEAPTSGRRLRRFVLHDLPASVRSNSRFTAISFARSRYRSSRHSRSVSCSRRSRRRAPAETPASRGATTLDGHPRGIPTSHGPLIIVNNVRVAVVAFAGGLTAGALTLYLLVANGAFLGTVLAVVQGYGLSGGLLAFTAAHGPLEISCIVLSGGAGLRLAWAILRRATAAARTHCARRGAGDPGDAPRDPRARRAGSSRRSCLRPTRPSRLKVTVGLAAGLVLWAYIAWSADPLEEPLLELEVALDRRDGKARPERRSSGHRGDAGSQARAVAHRGPRRHHALVELAGGVRSRAAASARSGSWRTQQEHEVVPGKLRDRRHEPREASHRRDR